MTDAEAIAFAQKHVAIWNSHEIDRIMDLYSDDAQLASPLAKTLTGDGILRGKPALRAYFADALATYPELEFELITTLRSVESITLYFKSIAGRIVAEVLFLDRTGRIARVYAHYACAGVDNA